MQGLILRLLLPPLLVSGALLLAALWAARHERARSSIGLVALAVGLGVAAGQAAALGVPRLPPLEARGWLFLAGPAAGLVAALVAARPAATRWIAAAAVALPTGWAILQPRIEHAWSPSVATAAVAGFVLAVLLLAWSADRLRSGISPSNAAAVLAGAAALLAPLLVFSGSVVLAQLAGILALALTPPFAASLAGGRAAAWGEGMVLPAAVLLAGLLAAGFFFAEMPAGSAVLFLLALPVAAGTGPVLARRPRRALAWVVAAALAVALGAAAVVLAWTAYDPNPYAGY
jgi:hypothetical protein